MKLKNLGLLLALGGLICNSACSVEGGRRSTSSSSYISSSSSVVITPSSSNSNQISSSSVISSSSSISTGLPSDSQAFIDSVNAIILDENAGDAINNAFVMFDSLSNWDFPEVLDAYNRLCEMEEEYIKLSSRIEKINLFLEKIVALPETITLDDEYLIIRAEDSYSKLDEELKSDPSVVEGYNKMVAAREAYQALFDVEQAKKDQINIASFLMSANQIPAIEVLTYNHYSRIEDALKKYEALSENAKNAEGVPEAYEKLVQAREKVNVQDGVGLFDMNVVHSGTAYEAIFTLVAKDDANKVSGVKKVFNLRVEENGVQVLGAHILSWGASNYSYSNTRSDGVHQFAYTIGKGYTSGAVYTVSFIVVTDAGVAYSVKYYCIVDSAYTSGGESEIELYQKQLSEKIDEFYENDYTEENWALLNKLLEDGIAEIANATNGEHARIISSQYYFEMGSIPKKYGMLENLKVVGVSSKEEQKDTMVDENTGSSWQASTTLNEYVIIDLGDVYSIEGMSIMWEVANAKDYDVKVSNNENEDWDSLEAVYQYRNGQSGNRTDEIRFSAECRYIKLELKTGATQWGFRIFEIDVYSGTASVENPETPDSITE